jgi:hypothetical protein
MYYMYYMYGTAECVGCVCVSFAANPDAYMFQPENTLKLKAWDHSGQDTTLLDLIPFLQMVQEVHVDVSDAGRAPARGGGGVKGAAGWLQGQG